MVLFHINNFHLYNKISNNSEKSIYNFYLFEKKKSKIPKNGARDIRKRKYIKLY